MSIAWVGGTTGGGRTSICVRTAVDVWLCLSAPVIASSMEPRGCGAVSQSLVTELFAACLELARAQAEDDDGAAPSLTADNAGMCTELLLADVVLPNRLEWLRSCSDLPADICSLERPAMLAALKTVGVVSLPDRQAVANAIGKAKRQREELRVNTQQQQQPHSQGSLGRGQGTAPGQVCVKLHTMASPGTARAQVAATIAATVSTDLAFTIRGSTMEPLRRALLQRGWREIAGEEARQRAAFKWTRKASVLEADPPLYTWQLVNHFRGAHHLVTKHGLSRNLRASALLDGADIGRVAPPTYHAADAAQLRLLIAHQHDRPCAWIVKSEGGRRGDGIALMTHLRDVLCRCRDEHFRVVVQEYVERPMLIRHRKFDVRLWALVTSINPLVWWTFDEYYLRFASQPYSADTVASAGHKAAHLTNYNVQRGCAEFGQAVAGNMMVRSEFRAELEAMHAARGGATPMDASPCTAAAAEMALFHAMNELMTAALRSVSDVVEHRDGTFELFGFDVLIDADLKPWLLEVNSSPGMDPSATPHTMVHDAMVDMVRLVLALNHEATPVSVLGAAREAAPPPCWRLACHDTARSASELRGRRFRKDCEAHGCTSMSAQPSAEAHNRPDLVVHKWLAEQSCVEAASLAPEAEAKPIPTAVVGAQACAHITDP